jgi:hypothetical protein
MLSAIMTNQLVPEFVEGKTYITILATGYPTTCLADLIRVIPPAVLEKNNLFFLCK